MMVIFTKVELGVNLQAGSGLKADDDSHHTCYLGGLWGDYNDDDESMLSHHSFQFSHVLQVLSVRTSNFDNDLNVNRPQCQLHQMMIVLTICFGIYQLRLLVVIMIVIGTGWGLGLELDEDEV